MLYLYILYLLAITPWRPRALLSTTALQAATTTTAYDYLIRTASLQLASHHASAGCPTYGARYKVVHDPVHKLIPLSDPVLQFMDTPEFQRLRDLKQLGLAYYVFPGARRPTHARAGAKCRRCLVLSCLVLSFFLRKSYRPC